MRLLYTDVANHLTKLLAREAEAYAASGKRVFYLAPNSLSFDKERQVLESLTQKASFAITVTRFGQMARYLTLTAKHQPTSLNDTGLSMVFYKVLSGLSDQDLRLYARLRQDPAFIKQLVDFYKEWQSSTLDWEDLAGLDSQKLADIRLIFDRVSAVLAGLDLSQSTPISHLRQALATGQTALDLSQVVVFVDGFTRFTAEEEALLSELNHLYHDVVIGVYASPKAYKRPFLAGNLYQASLDFLRGLAAKFAVKPEYLGQSDRETTFSRITQALEARYDFSPESMELTDQDKSALRIWNLPTVKDELEEVAKAIRSKLDQGHRYKDMLVLLGDVEAYQLHLKRVFDTYAIPYYLGKAEAMADHPLVQLIDSLERLVRYQFRAEDLLNLLKSGLFGQLDQLAIDKFEQYVTYANLKGKSAFSRPFTKTTGRFDLASLNTTRQTIMGYLDSFLTAQNQSVTDFLTSLLALLEGVGVRNHLSHLAQSGSQLEADRQAEVWQVFTQLLEQMNLILDGEDLSQADYLSLLRSGLLSATYRLVPATVDVVNVTAYNLIEPHTKPFVFAVGLSQSNFPEVVKNVSLLTDEDRGLINSHLADKGQLDLPSQDNLKRNNYTMMSLLNAATQELVLSSPTLLGETEDSQSSYLLTLKDLGLPVETKFSKGLSQQTENLGTYRSLLARLVEAHQDKLDLSDLPKETADYWAVLIRRLRKKLAAEGLTLPEVNSNPTSRPVSPEALAVRYPTNRPLSLSASALSDFYNNQYKYFLSHLLGLREEESVLPDARQHGIFFHRVFELLGDDRSDRAFDDKLSQALTTALSEPELASAYQQTAQTRYAQEVVTAMIVATSRLLADQEPVQIVAQEASFGMDKPFLLDEIDGRQITVRGKIDRLDRLVGSQTYGVVDYKSSDQRFKLSDLYNRLSPQLMTYLAALSDRDQFAQVEAIFGAMYLQVQEPQVNLTKTESLDDIRQTLVQELTYKGLFVTEDSLPLGPAYASKGNTFSPEELALLLAYNRETYRQAAATILSGQFAINPYTKDGKSVAGDQLKSITRFEADLHLNQARHLTNFPRKDQRSLILGAMAEQLDQTKEDKHV